MGVSCGRRFSRVGRSRWDAASPVQSQAAQLRALSAAERFEQAGAFRHWSGTHLDPLVVEAAACLREAALLLHGATKQASFKASGGRRLGQVGAVLCTSYPKLSLKARETSAAECFERGALSAFVAPTCRRTSIARFSGVPNVEQIHCTWWLSTLGTSAAPSTSCAPVTSCRSTRCKTEDRTARRRASFTK